MAITNVTQSTHFSQEEFCNMPFDPNPIQATYRGGVAEPLHNWYPYLEGYSPEFVKSTLRAFAPDAVRVLDPFAGMGTTPLTIGLSGGVAFYCEINPVLQYIIDAKSQVLALSEDIRYQLASDMLRLADNLESSLIIYKPDKRLVDTYRASFGTSQFFPNDTLDTCLRMRSWLDQLERKSPLIGALASVATLASLIPCSNMIRRGDLRFRRERERTSIVRDLAGEVCRRLQTMAEDVKAVQSISHIPVLVSEDAKGIINIPYLGIDAVITSPPYLNGTNYYRNTKIELWFLRELESAGDLRVFRNNAIMAGINDVTTERSISSVSVSVEKVVKELQHRAYDRRIPIMVSGYFADMKSVLDGLTRHASHDSKLIMDIGDSSYAGVHVNTPTILSEILVENGWKVDEEIPLRRRVSRNGQPLRQVLITATAKGRTVATSQAKYPGWEKFKKNLPHQIGDFAKRNWGSPLHSLCSYQGKLKPSIAHHLVKAFTIPGNRLLDPFGGVGTIPFEGALNGVKAWSFDISPVAVPIAAAKLNPASSNQCMEVISELEQFIKTQNSTDSERARASEIKFNGPLPDYYHPNTLDEILLARRFFQQYPPNVEDGSALVFACLLHILHGNRPYALSRRSHPITPFAPRGQAEYKKLIVKLTEKVQRSLAVKRPESFVSGSSLFQDATELWPDEINEIDAIVTSPPFYDSTRFYLSNWIRLWFAGWTKADFLDQPRLFLEERQKQGFEIYAPIIRQARERLKRDGVCVFHLGKSRKCDMASEVAKIARPWFRNIEIFSENVTHCESHGIRDKGTVFEHKYLLLS